MVNQPLFGVILGKIVTAFGKSVVGLGVVFALTAKSIAVRDRMHLVAGTVGILPRTWAGGNELEVIPLSQQLREIRRIAATIVARIHLQGRSQVFAIGLAGGQLTLRTCSIESGHENGREDDQDGHNDHQFDQRQSTTFHFVSVSFRKMRCWTNQPNNQARTSREAALVRLGP